MATKAINKNGTITVYNGVPKTLYSSLGTYLNAQAMSEASLREAGLYDVVLAVGVEQMGTGLLGGAGGGAGTARSQLALRQTSVFLDITYVNSPEVVINRFADPSVFDSDGNLVGEVWQERVENIFDRMIRLATKMSS